MRSAKSFACRRRPSSNSLLAGAETANEAALNAAEARVPKAAAIGDDGTPSIRAVHRETGSGKPRVTVDVAAPAGAPVTLFAEGPTAQWALPLPEPVAGAPAGLQRFAFELDGLPPGEKASGATLRLTAVVRRQGHRGRISARLIRRRRVKFADDLFRLFFARKNGLREGGKSVPIFRDHALV